MNLKNAKLYSIILSLAVTAGSFAMPDSMHTGSVSAEETPQQSADTVIISFRSDAYCGTTTFSTSAESGLSEVNVEVNSGSTLSTDQIPAADVTDQFIGWVTLNTEGEPVGNPYSSTELTSIILTEDTVFYPYYQIVSLYALGPYDLSYTLNESPASFSGLTQVELQAKITAMDSTYTDVAITLNQNTSSDSVLLIPTGVTCTLTSGTGGPYTVTRTSSNLLDRMIHINGTLVMSNIIYDGGAVWSAETDAVLLRGRTNSGLTCTDGNAQLIYIASGSALTMDDGAIIQNNCLQGAVSGTPNHLGSGICNYGGTLTMNSGSAIRNMTNSAGTYAADASAVSMISGNGIFNMNGGSITGCEGSRLGGAIRLSSGTINITGGSISNNLNSASDAEANAETGGGAFWINGGTLNISGGTISNNAVCSYAGRTDTYYNGGALYMSGGTVNISGNPSFTGNTAQGLGGAVYAANGTLNISGSPIITGNTGSSINQNIYLLSNMNINTVGDLTDARIGVTADTARNAAGNQFGIGNTYAGMSSYMNDTDTSLFGAAGSGTAIVWKKGICKIGTATYETLSDAVSAISKSGKIEMLVENYTWTDKITVSSGKDITITTANETGTGPFYQGPSGTYATMNRGSSYNGTFARVEGILRLDHITLDGGWNSGDTGNDTFIYAHNGKANVYLNAGATLQNNQVSENSGGAIRGDALLTEDRVKIYINEGSAITHCEAAMGGAIVAAQKASVIMTGGTISNCSTNGTTDNSASAILLLNYTTFDMSGGSIINNTATADSSSARGAVNLNSNSAAAKLKGGVIKDNTNTYSPLGAGVYSSSSDLTISGSMQIYDNTSAGNTVNVQSTKNINIGTDLTSDLRVGVTYADHMAAGNQFGVISDSSSASAVNNLGGFFNDSNPAVSLYGYSGSGSAVVWSDGVCRIGSTLHTTLQSAIDAISAGTALDINGVTGTAQTEYKIEMLKESYDMTAVHAIPAGKDVTVTTAPSTGAGPLYSGTEGTAASLSRSTYTGSFFTVDSSILHLNTVTLDGGWKDDGTGSDANAQFINVANSGILYLENKAVLKNNAGTDAAGAVSMTGTADARASLYMEDSSSITHCRNTSAGAVGVSAYGDIIMHSGTISNCVSSPTAAGNASAILLSDNATIAMSGGTVSGNTSDGTAAEGAVTLNQSTCSGTFTAGSITDNTNTASANGAGIYNSSGSLTIGGSMKVTGNTSSSKDANVQTDNSIKILPSLTADLKVGVTYAGHMAETDTFGEISTGASSSGIEYLSGFFNDGNSSIVPDLYGTDGTGADVVWGEGICRIGSVIYTSLQKAVNAISNGTATDLNGSKGTAYTDYLIEMLVEDYTLTAAHSMPSAKNVELTTASELSFTSSLHRSAALTDSALIRTGSNGSLTIAKLILDGDSISASGKDSAAISAVDSSSITLGDGAVIQNCINYSLTDASAGIYAGSNVTVTMNGSSAIRSCKGNAITAGGSNTDITLTGSAVIENMETPGQGLIYIAGSTDNDFTMSGNATIQNNTVTNTGYSGMVFYAADGGTSTLKDNAKIINNTSEGTCAGISAGSSQSLVLQNSAAITGNRGAHKAGGIDVLNSTQVSVSGAVQVKGNTLKDGADADITLNSLLSTPANTIEVLDSLEGASIGIRVPAALHEYYTRFAKAESSTVSLAAYDAFFDDLNPHLNIGANAAAGNAQTDGYDSYIYFMGPAQFRFIACVNDGNDTPIADTAVFRIYKYTGTGTASYFDGSADWSAYAYTDQDLTATAVTDFSNTLSTGLVDCGWMEDGIYAIVETSAPDAYMKPLGQWIMTVDSEQTVKDMFSFRTAHSASYTDDETALTMNNALIIESNDSYDADGDPDTAETVTSANGSYTYYIPFNVNQPVMKIKRTLAGDYADRSRDYSLTVSVGSFTSVSRYASDSTLLESSDIAADTPTVFNLKENEYLVLSGMTAGSAYTVTESIDGYTADITTTLPDDTSSVQENTSASSGTFSNGLTRIEIHDAYKTVASTGINDYTYPYLWVVSVPLLMLMFYLLYKMHPLKRYHS